MDPFPGRLSDFEALIIKVAYPSVVDPGQMVELWDRMGEVAPIPIQEHNLPKMSVRLCWPLAQRRSGSTVLQVQRSHPRQYGNGAITIPAASEDSEATVILPRV